MISLWLMLKYQESHVKQVQVKKELVKNIKEMEARIKQKTGNAPGTKAADGYHLQGTVVQSGIPQALINGNVYSQGDMIDDYTIVEITANSALLKNKNTNESIMLYFKEETPPPAQKK